ncbi:MAG TPA: S41 family peptidase [Stellaceae bacterium]|nr:S41 family peptidase [Stellaceae bacterium]
MPSRVRLLSKVRLTSIIRRVGSLIFVAALAACAGGRDVETGADSGYLFARGIEQITDLYIEPISGQKLVTVGAMNLAKLDDRLGVTIGGDPSYRDQLTLTNDGIVVAHFPVPPEIGATDAGQTIAAIIAAARKASGHVASMSEEAIDKAVFDGMTGTLDRFSRYSPPDEARDQRAARDGFGGIGVSLESTSDDFRITTVSEQSPAEHAGLHAGDRIVAIDGQPTAGHHAAEIIHLLRGPVASTVTVTIAREGVPGTRDYRIGRVLVITPTVTASRDGSVAIFRVASFNQSTTQLLSESIANEERAAGGHLTGIVLDLRGNPGGLLDQAVSLADLFIAKGPIIATVGRHPASHQYFAASGHATAPSIPLVVLINGGSASAAEIVAAALQDVGRAVVIGSSSYGKGTVQTVMHLPNDGELTLTWARLVTPSGYYLQAHGVIPTLCTAGLADDDGALDVALRRTADAAPDAVSASHPRASLDENAWRQLRQTCPARAASPAIDVKIAERVLTDPSRYGQAVGAIHPPAPSLHSGQTPLAPALTAATPPLSSKARIP